MNDFAAAMAPKSDQINAQDLLAGDLTITVRGVKVTPGTEQPVSIAFDGSDKVWRPCKTTGRILMAAWGADTSKYPGRSVQLYLDSEVKWGGLKVGGIRIRAISHIDTELRLALAESKQARKLVTIKPLAAPVVQLAAATPPAAMTDAEAITIAKREAEKGSDAFRAWFNTPEGKDCRATDALTPDVMAECKTIASGADNLGPRLDADPFGAADPPPSVQTDAEVERRLAEERAAFERDRAAEEARAMGEG